MTNNLRARVGEHRAQMPGSFTARYNIRYQYVWNAIRREKELKDWNRARKIEVIEAMNPVWEDLAADW